MPKGTPSPYTHCTIDGCGKPHAARGWCSMHYGRWRRFGDPLAAVGERLPWPDRLLSRMDQQPNGCIYYTGQLMPNGYGQTTAPTSGGGYRQQSVHRLAYEMFVGQIPEGLTLDHLCHTNDLTCPGGNGCLHRRCVNPAHLEPVTRGENTSRGGNAIKTHCKRGHEFTPENTYMTPGGARQCRACIPLRPGAA